jgi:hypothetical protein
MTTHRILPFIVAALALIPLTGEPVMARGSDKPTLKTSCAEDLEKHCNGVKNGKGRWVKCLRAKRAQISKRCANFLRIRQANKSAKRANKRTRQASKARAKAVKSSGATRTRRNPGTTAAEDTAKANPTEKSTTAESLSAAERRNTDSEPDSNTGTSSTSSSNSYSDTVWQAALAMPRKGKYVWEKPVKRPNQPTIINIPEPITIAGQVRFVPRDDFGSNCVGFTAAVGMRVINADSKLEPKITRSNWLGFWNRWMIVTGRKGAAGALGYVGLGVEVSFAEARRGDFVQLWRTDASGHSVIFEHWVDEEGNALKEYDADRAVGLKYISSNPPDGITKRAECFYVKTGCSKAACGSHPSRCKLKRNELYIGRLEPQ